MMHRDQNPDTMQRDGLEDTLRALHFVIVELSLYLDTHPYCKAAIARMKRAREEYARVLAVYEKRFGPMTVMGDTKDGEWLYATQSFPWKMED